MYEAREERDALFAFTGKYTEVKLLNKRPSGFGWAVLVEDNFEARRWKVIKLPNREEATRELLVEAQILTKIAQYLRHRNLIELGSVDRYVIEWNGKKEERWFLVLQYGGDDLRGRLGRLGLRADGGDEYVYRDGVALPLDEMLNISMQIADGLRVLHDFEESPGQHIVHRDIKPENILLDKQGIARLTDFGISKVVERITQSITVAGTGPYLAPEYSRGRLHSTSDIYSLGIVLYEMATGKFPFRSQQDRFYEMPAPPHIHNPRISAGLSDTILKCLWWNASAPRGMEEAGRYQSAADLLNDLRRCFSRLYPVPPRFRRSEETSNDTTAYRDTATERDVRVLLYEASQPSTCLSRMAATISVNIDHVACPVHAFESENLVGVAVPYVPRRGADMERPQVGSGEGIHELVARTALLCHQLESLHRLGVYHGFLNPRNVQWDGQVWWIDQVWLGPLVGVARIDAVINDSTDLAGYLAPEVLAWRLPPMLSSDIYGVGAVLYGHLLGVPPLEPPAALAFIRGAATPLFRPGFGIRDRLPLVTRRIEQVLVKALQPEPNHRHRTLEELLIELAACRWPDDGVATFVEDARQLQGQGKLVEAFDALDQAQTLDPGNPSVHHARAEIFFLEGSIEWALKENEIALGIDPTSSVCFLHAQCLEALGKRDEALQYVREGLTQGESSHGRRLLASYLEHAGEHREALLEYREAVRVAEIVERDHGKVAQIQADISALLDKLET